MNTVVLELVRESLIAVVNEMRANMIYASYSSVIFEGHDFSCALMTADGKQIAQGLADHPIHIFAVPSSTAEVLKQFAGDIAPGDVFLHNDPYTGGTHLNDVLMLYPIFDGEISRNVRGRARALERCGRNDARQFVGPRHGNPARRRQDPADQDLQSRFNE